MLRRLVCFVALACLCSGSRADRVVTHDGRVLHPKKAREEGQGYRLVFEAGEILLPSKELLKAVEIEGDMSDYVPKNDDEREKLEQGYVRYRGRWLSKAAYQNELDKEHEESRKRTAGDGGRARGVPATRGSTRPSTSWSSRTPRPSCSSTTASSWRRTSR